MFHQKAPNEFGFEVLRPDYNGDLELLQCSIFFTKEEVSLSTPEDTKQLFVSDDMTPKNYDVEGQYLIAYYGDFFIQFKIEPHEGLIVDVYDADGDTCMSTYAVSWEDF